MVSSLVIGLLKSVHNNILSEARLPITADSKSADSSRKMATISLINEVLIVSEKLQNLVVNSNVNVDSVPII